eukprot:32872_1
MRFNKAATSLLAIAMKPAFVQGFNTAPKATSRTATSLSALQRRPGSMFPILRRSDVFFPDMDQMLDEMDQMMNIQGLTKFARPASLSLHGRPDLGFQVTQDEKKYKVAVSVPDDMHMEDIELQLDHDGRVLRLKGEKKNEEEGMKVSSTFEKAILLSPDVDTSQLEASLSGDTLTVVAPKVENAKNESKKIDIKIMDAPKAALPQDGEEEPTEAVENPQEVEKV